MKTFTASILAAFILLPVLGAPVAHAAAPTKTFKGTGDTCDAAKKMARHAARKWRSAHCKEGHETSYMSAASTGDGKDVDCDKGADGKFTISRKVTCTKASAK